MVNPNWSKWIRASVNLHFGEPNTSVKTYLEGQEWDVLAEEKSYGEVRIDGPRSKEVSHNYFKLEVEIGIMASAMITNNMYEIDRLTGIYQARMIDIIVKRYGNDESYVGCLTLRDDVDPSIDTVIYGQSAEDKRIILASIEGHYRMELTGD